MVSCMCGSEIVITFFTAVWRGAGCRCSLYRGQREHSWSCVDHLPIFPGVQSMNVTQVRNRIASPSVLLVLISCRLQIALFHPELGMGSPLSVTLSSQNHVQTKQNSTYTLCYQAGHHQFHCINKTCRRNSHNIVHKAFRLSVKVERSMC